MKTAKSLSPSSWPALQSNLEILLIVFRTSSLIGGVVVEHSTDFFKSTPRSRAKNLSENKCFGTEANEENKVRTPATASLPLLTSVESTAYRVTKSISDGV